MTRPIKCTPIAREAIIKALRLGNTRTAACASAGISLDSLAAWAKRDSEFFGQIKAAESDAEREAVKRIRSAMGKNWTAAAWWLERRRPDEWGKVDRVEITIRQQAEEIARQYGLDVDELIKQAEEIAAHA